MDGDWAERIIAARARLVQGLALPRAKAEGEGGCGVLGLASSFPVPGRHLVPGAAQMRNRGNGKGGGLAAAGLAPAQMRVAPEVLREATLLQVAYLDDGARAEVERECLAPAYDIIQGYAVPTVGDYREVPGLIVPPPQVWRYFVRARPASLARFAAEHGLEALEGRRVEDEFVYQRSFELNRRCYASLGHKRAFVLCHGRDLVVFKIVGYAEEALAYYRLQDLAAHVWIAHQRYPTKGRVWHPGGAHPFIGLNEALVHNGDFANYYGVASYLRQRNIVPLFLTDTEVAALLFDLYDRVYGYPLEALIEALAPTGERDFDLLPRDTQRLYAAIQATHAHAAPDGPWFFIVARSRPDEARWQLLGITDTSMLRPQVFALLEATTAHADLRLGLIASEKQAIDATLASLHHEQPLICPVADRYWNARGGSASDGGAFRFTVERSGAACTLTCEDKFGRPVTTPADQRHANPTAALAALREGSADAPAEAPARDPGVMVGRPAPLDVEAAWAELERGLAGWSHLETARRCRGLVDLAARGAGSRRLALELLSRLRDRAVDPGAKRRASVVAFADEALALLLAAVPLLDGSAAGDMRRLDRAGWAALRPPRAAERALVVDVAGFPPEGEEGASRALVEAVRLGWRQLVTYGWRGQRFCGCGLGPEGRGVRIDVYGASGDYLASGLDGAEVHVHGSAQDQVGQILRSGRLVVHGDVGQAFLYGAKGGEVYVHGSAAGRPLINAVGRPRVVINGTCLDYLAESFMAGDPLDGGGFAVVNGVTSDEHGRLVELPTPYPGGNLFSLASGGAVYLRDPHRRLDEAQLNGGRFAPCTPADWALIRPCLEENERLFGIAVTALLTVDGERRPPEAVYRKVAPAMAP